MSSIVFAQAVAHGCGKFRKARGHILTRMNQTLRLSYQDQRSAMMEVGTLQCFRERTRMKEWLSLAGSR
jgi:hypothetical protein